MSLLKAIEAIPRKTTVVFLVLDISPSLTERKLRVLLEAVGELKDTLSRQSESRADYQVKIAALQFDSLCTWVPETGPVETARFFWQIPFAGKSPAVRFDEMCNALNEQLSKKRFMSDATGYYPPVIVLFSGTDYSGAMNDSSRAAALEALQKLHKNNWFKYADKCAVALGRTTDKGLLAQWTGDDDTVLSANTPSALRRIIASINMPRLSMPNIYEGVYETEDKTGVTPMTPKESPQPMTLEFSKYADIAREYKKSLSRNFISLAPHKIDEYLGNSAFFVTRKYDGELALIFFENENLYAVNSGGAPLPDLPCRKEAAACLREAGIRQGAFAAELYADESRGRTRVFDTISALAEPRRHDSLRFAFFDILGLNGADWRRPFEETYATLSKIFNAHSCAPVRGEKVSSKEKVKELFDRWVTQEGGEGLVIRTGDRAAVKIKPRVSVDAAITGFSESDERGAVRTLLYALRKEDGSWQVIGRTGNGLSGEQKRELFTRLMPLEIPSNYIEVDSNHAVFHIIKPELVVELSANDVLCENSSGMIKNPLLEMKDGALKHCATVHGYSLVSAVIERLREDKKPDITAVRISQLEERIFNPLAQKEHITETHAPSQILVREVYRKESKAPMVMKFLVWKTNKEHEGNYPAYVFSYTNFSVSRADPLALEVRVSNSEAQIMGFYRDYAAKNVKTGWTRQ
jgi:uncharacterized protein YegL